MRLVPAALRQARNHVSGAPVLAQQLEAARSVCRAHAFEQFDDVSIQMLALHYLEILAVRVPIGYGGQKCVDAPHGAGVVAQLLEMPQVKCALDGLRATDIDVVTVSAKLRQALVALREVRGDEADACILGQRQRLCGDVLDSAFENAGAEQFAAHAPRCAALAEDQVRDVGAEARIAWRLAVVLGERTVVVEPGLRVADIEPELHDVVSAPAGITLREAGPR